MEKKISKNKTIQNSIRKIRILKKKTLLFSNKLKSKVSSTNTKKTKTITKNKSKTKTSKTSRRSSKARTYSRVKFSNNKVLSITPQAIMVSEEKEVVEVSKFSAVIPKQEKKLDHALPVRYYDDKVVLLARDPWWLHAYWDISQDRIDQVVNTIPHDSRDGLNWILRVYDVTGLDNFSGKGANSYFDLGINFDVNRWYLNVVTPEKSWCVEIGLVARDGSFFMVARSNMVKTPNFGISDIIDEEWAMPDEEYFKILGVYEVGKSSMQMRKKFESKMRKQISSGAFSGNISSLFSKQEKKRKFFLEVWTEVILYGRTEATADVSVCGKKIDLRKDGTFTKRYALPQGDFKYEVKAISEDKIDTLREVPAVKRYSKKQ